LLLTLRSALEIFPLHFTVKLLKNLHVPLLVEVYLLLLLYFNAVLSVNVLSVIHFRKDRIQKVTCYTFLRGFRVPWPLSLCLHFPSSFVVSINQSLGTLSKSSVHPALPILLTKTGPLNDPLFVKHKFNQIIWLFWDI